MKTRLVPVTLALPLLLWAPATYAQDAEEDISLDDIELSEEEKALLRELEADSGADGAAEEPSLRLYGFADFLIGGVFGLSENTSAIISASTRSNNVLLGNLNLYLDANLTHGFSFLAEVRFHVAPVGNKAVDFGDGTANPNVHARAVDLGDFGREFDFGYIEIERAYLQYEFAAWLKGRVGILLTPYGVWNVDHGSPVIIPIRRPYLIGDGFIPEQQTGFEILGSVPVGPVRIGYHAYATNGRGVVSRSKDVDDNFAFGGRVYVDTAEIGRMRVGGSFYSGTEAEQWQTFDPSTLATGPQLKSYYRTRSQELALAADFTWDIAGFRVQSEVISRQVVFDDNARPSVGANKLPDHSSIGAYGLLAYELPFWNLQPYILYEYIDFGFERVPNSTASSASVIYAGLRIRPIPTLAFKLQYTRASFDAAEGSAFSDPINMAEIQTAFAF